MCVHPFVGMEARDKHVGSPPLCQRGQQLGPINAVASTVCAPGCTWVACSFCMCALFSLLTLLVLSLLCAEPSKHRSKYVNGLLLHVRTLE